MVPAWFQKAYPHPALTTVTYFSAGNLFTTQTAVAAGFDRFPPSLIEQYLTAYSEQKLHIPVHDLLALGRANPADASEPFNMAYLAVHGSGAINGVSRLHGVVSRQLFAPLFPRWAPSDVPIGSVTNGIHTPTWTRLPWMIYGRRPAARTAGLVRRILWRKVFAAPLTRRIGNRELRRVRLSWTIPAIACQPNSQPPAHLPRQ